MKFILNWVQQIHCLLDKDRRFKTKHCWIIKQNILVCHSLQSWHVDTQHFVPKNVNLISINSWRNNQSCFPKKSLSNPYKASYKPGSSHSRTDKKTYLWDINCTLIILAVFPIAIYRHYTNIAALQRYGQCSFCPRITNMDSVQILLVSLH